MGDRGQRWGARCRFGTVQVCTYIPASGRISISFRATHVSIALRWIWERSHWHHFRKANGRRWVEFASEPATLRGAGLLERVKHNARQREQRRVLNADVAE